MRVRGRGGCHASPGDERAVAVAGEDGLQAAAESFGFLADAPGLTGRLEDALRESPGHEAAGHRERERTPDELVRGLPVPPVDEEGERHRACQLDQGFGAGCGGIHRSVLIVVGAGAMLITPMRMSRVTAIAVV